MGIRRNEVRCLMFAQQNGTPFLAMANIGVYELALSVGRMQSLVKSVENLFVQLLVQQIVPVDTTSIKSQTPYTLLELQQLFGTNGIPARDEEERQYYL